MDTDLVIRAQHGDQQAFADLVTTFAVQLRKAAYGVLRDMDLAEDAAQQAVVAIWRDLPRLRDPHRFGAWSYRILLRTCYAQRRWSRTKASVPLYSWIAEPVARDALPDVLLRDQLERGFARLSIEHRAVIVLYHQLGLSLAEISEALAIPVGTVKSRLHRAIASLRASMAPTVISFPVHHLKDGPA